MISAICFAFSRDFRRWCCRYLCFPLRSDSATRVFLAPLLVALFSFGMLLEKSLKPHYPAPGFGLAILMIAFGFRYLRLFARSTTRDGLTGSRLIAILSLLVPIVPAYQFAAVERDPSYRAHDRVAKAVAGGSHRAVILVRYSPHHDLAEEWVYNQSHR